MALKRRLPANVWEIWECACKGWHVQKDLRVYAAFKAKHNADIARRIQYESYYGDLIHIVRKLVAGLPQRNP